MYEELTTRQKEILEFIKKTTFRRGSPPTYREIMEYFGFKSIGTVQDHLKALEKKGYIKREPNKYRAITVDDFSKTLKDTVRVPILGQISAGRPVLAEENIEGYISLDKFLVKYSRDVFALKVKGDSMAGAGILDGDYVIVRKQPEVENGEIACVLVDNEATVKRFFKKKEVIMRLRPSYFPFTEPSFEIDILYERNKEKKWIETLGAGMVHPNVFKVVGLNPKMWQGFAFGLGIDRLAMMKYRINDIRLFYSGDLRFLKQF